MKKRGVLDILKGVGAIINNDHFVLTTGRHSDGYINKDTLYTHPVESSEVGLMFAEKYRNTDIDVVAAPALGGIVLSQWTAYHLSKLRKKEILSVYTEKTPDKQQIFTRKYDEVVKGKKVLVIEDLTTTGGSVKKVVEAVRDVGGVVESVCVMVNREPDKVNSQSVGAVFDSLDIFKISSYEERDCPMCKKNIPINTKVGHGKKYLESKK